LLISSSGDLSTSKTDNYAGNNTATVVRVDETERFEQTYPLNANGRVSVSNVNGSITVDVWDRNEVKLTYVKTADLKENLNDVQIIIEARQDSFAVETEYEAIKNRTSKNYRKLEVEYRLTVPRNAVINEIETVNGSVSLTGTGNMTKASAVNGEVRATNLRGTASLSTVNGTVIADFNELQTGGKISLNTVNGTVDLILPSDVNATIKADTVNGSINNDFGLPVRKGEYVGRDLYGKVGSGDVQIRLNSVNGALSIKRKNDGKTVNPATNLLNMKSEGDHEDWDDEDTDSNTRVKPPKPPKAPKPPVIDSEAINRSVEDALKEASKELGKINPELQKLYSADLEKQIREANRSINPEELREQIKEAKERYKEALAELSDVNWKTGSPVIEKKSQTFSVKGTPNVRVETKNCAVSVRGWDKSEVSYSLVTINRDNQKPTNKNSNISIKNTDSEVDIKVLSETTSTGGEYFDEATKMHLEIYVPRKSNLKIISNLEIRLEGVSGEIDLQGAEETVNVRDSDGKLSVKTAHGRIRVIGFRGAFDGKTTDGAMNLEGDFQQFSARTTDGTIVLTLPENAKALIESNSKQVIAEGFALEHQGDKRGTSKWKIGDGGGTNYLFYATADGKVFIRTANALKTN
jgi:DUF4097 and DUF4098 domain-containing protein YvlB